ncbi:MAG: O-antigen ligase family protein, partial [Bacteroidia bacterium]|nr:O-antigen ligase family protein [Bacteroidia bacterium]
MTPEGQMTSNSKFISIIINFLIITGLVQAVWGLLQLYGMTRSFHSGFKITGTFFNPAPYALYLAAVFPLALGTLLSSKKLRIKELKIKNGRITHKAQMIFRIKNLKIFGTGGILSLVSQFFSSLISSLLIPSLLIINLTYCLSLLTVISIILVLPATMNRASWLGVAAGSLIVFNYRYNLLKKAKAFLHNTARKLCALAIVILLTGSMGAGLYLLKKGSSDGKLLIWEVTIGKISEKPLFGHGVGRFEAEYNNWQAAYFKSHPEDMGGLKGMAAE